METLRLVENLRRGEDLEASQEQLYARVRDELLSRIERRVTHNLKVRLEAEDVLHEAFLRALHSIDVFRPDSDRAFYAWVYSIAKHLLIDQSRRRSVQNLRFAKGTGVGGPRLSGVRAGGSTPESVLARREWVADVLSRLKERDAEVLRLRQLEEKSFEEIAELWEMTPGAVQRCYSRALERFRAAVCE